MSNDNPSALGSITINRMNRSIATDATIQLSDILGATSRLAARDNCEDIPAIRALIARSEDLATAVFQILEADSVDTAEMYRTVRGSEMPEGEAMAEPLATNPDPDRSRLKAGSASKDKATKAELQEEVAALREKLEWVATLSATTMDQVSSFLRVTLIAMQSPDAFDHIGNIASTLEALWGITMDADNCMQAELDSIGIRPRSESREAISAAEAKSLSAYRKSVVTSHFTANQAGRVPQSA